MKKLLILALIIILTACSAPTNTYTRYTDVSTTSGFDTSMTLLAYTKTEAEFNTYFELMKSEFSFYNELFDKYKSYNGVNNIKTINDNAGVQPVIVDDAVIDMLLQAKKYTQVSDYFDVTLGAMLRIWHDYREKGIILNEQGLPGEVPTFEQLQAAMSKTGWDKVIIDETAKTVYLTEKGMELDVGAIAKGYATEKVALKLEEEGLTMAVVSGGGNIRTINTKPENEAWAIGIQEPSNIITSTNVDILSIPYSVSIVTSGDYQRAYYGPNETMYSHLINPKTLFPATNFRSVSVVTKDSTMADALSTALYMMSYEEGLEFVNAFNASNPENRLDVFWVVNENKDWHQGENFDYQMTENLNQYSKNLQK